MDYIQKIPSSSNCPDISHIKQQDFDLVTTMHVAIASLSKMPHSLKLINNIRPILLESFIVLLIRFRKQYHTYALLELLVSPPQINL